MDKKGVEKLTYMFNLVGSSSSMAIQSISYQYVDDMTSGYYRLMGAIETMPHGWQVVLEDVAERMTGYRSILKYARDHKPTIGDFIVLERIGEALYWLRMLGNYDDIDAMGKADEGTYHRKFIRELCLSQLKKTCVCGRVCADARGLAVHQHSCDGHRAISGFVEQICKEGRSIRLSNHGPVLCRDTWTGESPVLLDFLSREVRKYPDF